MFEIGDIVMHGNNGACRISDIRSCSFAGMPARTYYILNPVYDKESTFYVPVDNDKIRLRKLLAKSDVYDLIKIMPDDGTPWIDNDAERNTAFTDIIRRGDHTELIKLIKTLYNKREEVRDTGRKFHVNDERAMRDAEKMLYEEFALVLNIDPDEVIPYITERLAGE